MRVRELWLHLCRILNSAVLKVVNDISGVVVTSHSDVTLNTSGMKLLSSVNLCDSSLHSEAVSCTIITDLFPDCTLYKGEVDIQYFCQCKKTDYIVVMDGMKVAVEVKRVSSFGGYNFINQAYVDGILTNAAEKAQQSNKYVMDCDAWSAQILSILADDVSVIDLVAASTVNLDGFSMVIVSIVPF